MILRSATDLRPSTETEPTYLRRDGDTLTVRRGGAVRRLPLTGPDAVDELVTYEYEQRGARGAPYRKFGLLVRSGDRTVAHLGRALSPMWDTAEVRRFAGEWGLRARHAHFSDNAAFAEKYPKVERANVTTRPGTVGGWLMVLMVVVVPIAGAVGGLAGLQALAEVTGLAERPGIDTALFVPGVALGGVGCLFLFFAAVDLVRRTTAALRARTVRDGALRPTPRRGVTRLTVDRAELVLTAPDGVRLVLPRTAVLRPYRVSTSDGETGLYVDVDGRTALAVRCGFAPGDVTRFGAATGVPVGDEVTASPGAHQLRLGTLDPDAVVTPRQSPGFFTVTVGATVLGVLAYTPLVVGLVLLLGLFLPEPVVRMVGFLAGLAPLPLLGPVSYRVMRRRS
ncbi:hypothetical protein [Actinocatenispora rupis]|uniref:Uncharacterized protein n=1 Tax=Actinocatenispora rupis TaxID=519421 RepID=A0A8J3J6G5_9ACTN|nr:hypothetical protein [Actinocatenispora rupis]GID09438.1 hypothetical protein Aru02nite_03270 [Actinocatenispora rupis]